MADAEKIVENCHGCQYYATQPRVPAAELKTIPITWPFAVWGLDMVGKLKKAPSGFEYLLVAVDKFTKWIEAKPVRKADGATALKFIRDLVTRFGLPHSIITDNGTVVDMLTRYPTVVSYFRQARVAHSWWLGPWPNRAAQLLIDQGGESS